MEAIVLKKFGAFANLDLAQVPTPTITSKQILVKRLAVAVEPYDVHFVAGNAGTASLPVIVGSSIVGEVIAVGSEVTDIREVKVGDRIVAAPHLKACAEYVAIGRQAFAVVPDKVSDAVAVSQAVAGQTAYQMINAQLQPQAGETILIHGGAGAVGYTALQLALLRGAKVYTTARQHHQAQLEALGDVTVIDYQQQSLKDVLNQVDYVLDTVGGATLQASLAILAPKGKLVSLVDDPTRYKTSLQDAQQVFMKSRGSDLSELLQLIAATKVVVQIDQVVPFNLANLKRGYQLSQANQLNGKYVLA